MSRLTVLAALPLLFSCTNGPGTFEGFEICNNGIDDNNDGLTDCEDEATCGGPDCRFNNSGETGVQLGDVRIEWKDGQCDFLYGDADCTKLVCTILVTNDTEEEGFVTSSCDNPIENNYDNILDWRNAQQATGRTGGLSNSPLDAKDTAEIELYYDCFMPNTEPKFTASCNLRAEADNKFDTKTFSVEGINTDAP